MFVLSQKFSDSSRVGIGHAKNPELSVRAHHRTPLRDVWCTRWIAPLSYASLKSGISVCLHSLKMPCGTKFHRAFELQSIKFLSLQCLTHLSSSSLSRSD